MKLLSTAVAVLSVDQLAKALVVSGLTHGKEIRVFGPVTLRQVRNTGSAFGLFSQNPVPVLIVSLTSLVLLFFFLCHWKVFHVRTSLWGMGLIVGGATGNIVDRIFRGSVVDFIDIGPWPVFNLADVAIVTGVFLLVFVLLGEAFRPMARGRGRQ